jgi:hypothetical protein
MIRIQRMLWLATPFGLMAAALSAGCASPEARWRQVDAQADAALKQMCDTLDRAKAFHFRVSATMDRAVETGQLAQFQRTTDITVVRPDRMYTKTDSDDGHWSAWYRGKTLTVLDREANTYATETVPARVGGMLDYMADRYDLVIPMADLLIGKTYDSLLAKVEEGSYVGLRTVGESKCHHLWFRQENVDWQIWIDSGAPALPRRLVITYTQQPNHPQYVASLDAWDLAAAPPAETFTFTPPTGATSVAMADLISERRGEQP